MGSLELKSSSIEKEKTFHLNAQQKGTKYEYTANNSNSAVATDEEDKERAMGTTIHFDQRKRSSSHEELNIGTTHPMPSVSHPVLAPGLSLPIIPLFETVNNIRIMSTFPKGSTGETKVIF